METICDQRGIIVGDDDELILTTGWWLVEDCEKKSELFILHCSSIDERCSSLLVHFRGALLAG